MRGNRHAASRRECGFLITVLDHGNLACLLDAEAPWLQSDFEFVPGHWYYVASTFQTTAAGETIVNAYASDLTAGEPNAAPAAPGSPVRRGCARPTGDRQGLRR